MIDGRNFFDQPIKNDLTIEKMQQVKVIITQQGVYQIITLYPDFLKGTAGVL